MAKQSGLGDQLYVAGFDLSGDIGSLGAIGGGPAALEVTGINKEAPERLGGLRDGRVEFDSWFNPAAGQAHPVLGDLPTGQVIVSYFRGQTLGGQAASIVARQPNYDGTRGADGALSFAAQTLGDGFGLEWGDQLTAGRDVHSGAANGTGVDFGAASTFGLQAYLQVFDFDGTDVTIKLQESADNAAADAYADVVGGGFGQVTAAPDSERIATADDLAVERWLRVVTVTTGGFTSVDFAVMVARNLTAPEF